ncbi:MAG: hypothetical protein IK020_06460 [Clostridiales bacterium]|nr:hypothetical protein [Clostridiales bacterium]
MDPKFFDVHDEEKKTPENASETVSELTSDKVAVANEVAQEASEEVSEQVPDEVAETGGHALVEVIPGPILSPETLSGTDSSVGFPKTVEDTVPFYKDRNFWKNVVVIACAVILIGVIAGVVGYMAGKKGSDETTRKTKTSEEAETTQPGASDDAGDTSAVPSGKLSIYGLRAACVKAGMTIVEDADAAYDFMAIDGSMKLVVTLKEVGEIDFDQLVTTMIKETTNVEADKLIRAGNIVRYDGLQDKEHAEKGYCFLELIYVDGHYVFVQGLGESEQDSVILSARNLASAVEKELGLS